MNTTEKILKLIKGIGYKSETVVVREGELYSADWEECPHSGNISDYAETAMSDARKEALLRELEEEYSRQAVEKFRRRVGRQALYELYAT